MNQLKQKLLSLNLVEDNEFLDKYVELIVSNRGTKREKYKTQRHHIVPKSYFSHCNITIDNAQTNCVNLVYCDHILAHYYLALCSKELWFKYANEKALASFFNKTNNYSQLDIDKFINKLPLFQSLYEESKISVGLQRLGVPSSNKGIKLSDETKKKISEAFKGRTWINKNNKSKFVKRDELDSYLKDGWNLGQCENKEDRPHYGKHHSEETKRIIGLKSLGRKHTEEVKQKMSERNSGENNPFFGKHHSNDTKLKLAEYARLGVTGTKGKHLSDVSKKRHSDSNKLFYLNNKTVWVTNGVDSKRIVETELYNYIALGYSLGRKIMSSRNIKSKES